MPDFVSFAFLFQNSNFILKENKIVILTILRNLSIYLSIKLGFHALNLPNKHDSDRNKRYVQHPNLHFYIFILLFIYF